MDVLITYDLVEGKQTEVKDAMKAKGYMQTINGVREEDNSPAAMNLPNTTLWKPDTSPEQARTDLTNAVKICGSKLERVFATGIMSGWRAIIGQSYDS